MRYFTVSVKGRPVVVKTVLSDVEAWNQLASLHDARKDGFVKGLLAVPIHHMSHLQKAWMHKLVIDAASKPQVSDFRPVLELFNLATPQKIKQPKITFAHFELEPGTRIPGSVHVRGSLFSYGRIMPDGKYMPAPATPAFVHGELAKLAKDPIGYAMEHGRACGKCCFCNHALKDQRSLAVGYGSTCAKNYNMPWGKVILATDC